MMSGSKRSASNSSSGSHVHRPCCDCPVVDGPRRFAGEEGSRCFFGRHPRVRDLAVHRVEPLSLASEHLFDPDGQVVDLVTDKGKFIARGFYNSHSRIRVRLYTWSEDERWTRRSFGGESRWPSSCGSRSATTGRRNAGEIGHPARL